jgi:hypothetical protein
MRQLGAYAYFMSSSPIRNSPTLTHGAGACKVRIGGTRRERNLGLEPLGIVAYLLTFHCYGTRLRGDEEGSVDRTSGSRGGPLAPAAALVEYGSRTMTHAEATLDFRQGCTVLAAIRETCAFRGWTLLAAQVRNTHAHMVVDGIAETSAALRDFKAYASRALNRDGVRRRWARGGNVRLLRDARAVRETVHYVVERQGTPMAVYVAPDL